MTDRAPRRAPAFLSGGGQNTTTTLSVRVCGGSALIYFGRAWRCCGAHTGKNNTHHTPSAPRSALWQPRGRGGFMALKQACFVEYHEAQGAFKDSMTHGILQFTLPIAFRCVLHRWENLEIRCRKLYLSSLVVMIQQQNVHSYSKSVCSVPPKRLAELVHRGLDQMYSEVDSPKSRSKALPEGCPSLKYSNDPSAGSPTETLLRLLLPLNDQVCISSQRPAAVAGVGCQSQRLTKPFNR